MGNTRKGSRHGPIRICNSVIFMLKSPIITMGSSGNSRCRASKARGRALSTRMRSALHGT